MRTLTLALVAAAALAAADDPSGWTRAKWGMTTGELAAIFPDAKPNPPEKDAVLALDPIDLADTHFRVVFFKNAAGRLAQVDLSPSSKTDWTDGTFQRLENALVEKYGRAWKTDEGDITTLQWTFPTTVIQLRRIKLGATLRIVDLIYKQRSPDSL